jgi:Heterokaryon incompatibility protein (HET)
MGNEDRIHIYGKPLSASFFRLLKIKLEPPHSSSNISISCRLEAFPREMSPAYSALSYSWDDAEGSEMASQSADDTKPCILLEGRRVNVGSNLYHALLRLPSCSYWWIDALCINQMDTVERNTQVSIMHNIYRAAEKVFVWLGPDKMGETLLVRELLRFLLQRFVDDEVSKYEQNWLNKDNQNALLAAGLPALEHPIWKAVVRFWDRRWFSRVWVRQEVAVGCAVEIWCGDIEFTMTELIEASRFNALSGLGEALLLLKSEPPWKSITGRKIGCGAARIEDLRLWANGVSYSEPQDFEAVANRLTGPISKDKHPLLRIFAVMLFFTIIEDASDSRDKIFAPLVLMRQIAESYDVPQLPLQVDYSKSQQDVYYESTSWIITESGCLGILCLLQQGRPVQRNQSWVPNYSGSFPRPLCLFKTESSSRVDTFRDIAQLQVSPVVRNSAIIVHAKYCGRVADVGDTYESMIDQGCFELCASLLLNCPEIMSNGRHRLEVWQRTMHGSNARNSSVSCADLSADFKQWLVFFILRQMYRDFVDGRIKSAREHLEKMPSFMRMAEIDKTKTLPDWAFWNGVVSDGGQISKYLSHTPRFDAIEITDRRLFRTSDPLYIGIGPKNISPGDEVWIIAGATFPLILRQVLPSNSDSSTTAAYSVVGESYVDDVHHVVESLRDGAWQRLALQ